MAEYRSVPCLSAEVLCKGARNVRYQQPWGISDPNASFINGNPGLGLAGSIPSAECVEHPQREIVNAITKANLTPQDVDLYQLLKAIRTQFYNYAVDTGTTNVLSCIFDPPLMTYRTGFVARVKVRNNNSGPAQIDCGPGLRPIIRIDGLPLQPNDMVMGGIAILRYLEPMFQLANPNAVSGGVVTGGGTGAGNVVYVTNQYNVFQAMRAWMDPGTYDWVVPDDVSRGWLRLWGGGGGGYMHGDDAKVGGDGGYCEGLVDLI